MRGFRLIFGFNSENSWQKLLCRQLQCAVVQLHVLVDDVEPSLFGNYIMPSGIGIEDLADGLCLARSRHGKDNGNSQGFQGRK